MDFILHGGPQDFLLTPLTDNAQGWALLHSEDNGRRLGRSVLVLRDNLDVVLEGIDDEGLTVEDKTGRKSMYDFTLEGHSVEFHLHPVTDDAKDWLKSHIPEDADFLGEGIVILRWFLDDILKGINDDGLTVDDKRKVLS